MDEPNLFPSSVEVNKKKDIRSRLKRPSSEQKAEWSRKNSDPLNEGQFPVVIGVHQVPSPRPLYAVTENGDVYSLHGREPIKMKPRGGTTGYLQVSLWIDGRFVYRTVHRLMMEAFGIEKPHTDAVVRHLDGNRLNNHLLNLEWGTHKENSRDSVLHGVMGRNARITKEEAMLAIRLLLQGDSLSSIGRRLGVTYVHIANIRDRRSWAHIKLSEQDQAALKLSGRMRRNGRMLLPKQIKFNK